jgi:hypothetical protein
MPLPDVYTEIGVSATLSRLLPAHLQPETDEPFQFCAEFPEFALPLRQLFHLSRDNSDARYL